MKKTRILGFPDPVRQGHTRPRLFLHTIGRWAPPFLKITDIFIASGEEFPETGRFLSPERKKDEFFHFGDHFRHWKRKNPSFYRSSDHFHHLGHVRECFFSVFTVLDSKICSDRSFHTWNDRSDGSM